MLGPQGASLLAKLGRKSALEMTDTELHNLVLAARDYRGRQRALGRAARIMKDGPRRVVKLKQQSLEALGFATAIAAKLRATNSGKSDAEIIALMEARGVI